MAGPCSKRRHWTKEKDATIISMKAEGKTWVQVAAALGETAKAVSDRGYRIGVPRGTSGRRPPPPKYSPIGARAAATSPLEPGHELTWNPLWRDSPPPDFRSIR